MRNFSKDVAVAVLSAIAMSSIGVGSAAAADVTVPQYRESQEYYREPPIDERYIYRPPAAVYPAPPAVTYYEYEPRPVVVVPGAYYPRRPYFYGRPYAFRGHGPYFARGYGRYGGPRNYGRRW
jgi:hypothetical protein